MKKITCTMISFISLFLIGLGLNPIFSQTTSTDDYSDVITMKTGEDIKCMVLEVGIDEIKYKKQGITPIYTVLKADVFSITYLNGTKDVFNVDSDSEEEEEEIPENLYSSGYSDADLYYPAKNTGAGGTALVTILISPLFGLIPAGICSSTEPSRENLGVNDLNSEVTSDSNYMQGYKERAHEIKKKKVWNAYGAGCMVWGAVFLIYVATTGN